MFLQSLKDTWLRTLSIAPSVTQFESWLPHVSVLSWPVAALEKRSAELILMSRVEPDNRLVAEVGDEF
jgi:hypothetical protein